jgi:hypothetical protein
VLHVEAGWVRRSRLFEGGEKTMMDMNDMMERCMDAMGSMMGGSMMGGGAMLFVLLLVLLIWVIGLAAVGALVFWAVRKLSEAQHHNG